MDALNTVGVLKVYLSMNVLFFVATFILVVLRHLALPLAFGTQLRLAYVLLASSLLVPLASLIALQFFPVSFIEPTGQIWTASSMKYSSELVQSSRSLTVSMLPMSAPTDLSGPLRIIFALFGFGFFVSAGMVLISMGRMWRILTRASLLRRFRSVRILVSDDISVPLSFWVPLRNYVVLPSAVTENPDALRLSLSHEMQHHRQKDTRWLHIVYLLRTVCFWNPFVYLFDRQLSNLQEFACDEALVGHRNVSSLAYCRCLLWVAENSLRLDSRLVGTASMANGTAEHVLKRRIQVMLSTRKVRAGKSLFAFIGTLSLSTMVGVALAANSSIQDRRVSLEQARELAEAAKRNSDFPIVVNDLVLQQLNRFVGTPDGREYMRQSIAQMQNHVDIVVPAVEKYRLPVELLAIPVIESGYRNRPQDNNAAHGAGIWMFIRTTARNYGLKVDDTIDQRLNVVMETDAAMRLLSALNLQFKDWGLALLGYNAGSGTVLRGIRETGSRDVWHLVRSGYDNDPGYVAKVMAAVLILKNPALLD